MRRLVFAVTFAIAAVAVAAPRATSKIPARLSDKEFWQLSTDASEQDGYFRSDNLTSNELGFLHVVPELVSHTRPGEVYLGVGPEQNYTYIAATKPAMAIIFDIRRGNLLLQLMYKAIFELSSSRADFVSMLFSRPRPEGLNAETNVTTLFGAFGAADRSDERYAANTEAILTQLTKKHGFALSPPEVNGIRNIYHAFFERGFATRRRTRT
jgi:hypothetical protein